MTVRVAIDATPVLGRPTGVGSFVLGLTERLALDPDLSLSAYALSLRNSQLLSDYLAPSVTCSATPMPAALLSRVWARFDGPVIERWMGTIDVVHGTNFVVPPTRRAAALVTVHDLAMVLRRDLCSGSSLQYASLVRRAIERGAHVHTPTRTIAAEVVSVLGADADRVHVVNHGLADAPTGPGSDAGVGRALAGSNRYVVAVGTVEPRKDYPTLIRAFDLVAATDPDLHLVVAGSPGWGMEAFTKAQESAAYTQRIRHLGWVDDIARAAVIRGAAALVFPSIYEGFGFPPLEAMKEAVPVVTTRDPAIMEVVGDAALLVDVGNAEELAKAINTVLQDESLRAQLTVAGHRRVEAFTWERAATEMASVYSRVAAGG